MNAPLKRLFDRAEPLFVIFWIVVYCAISLPLRNEAGDESMAMLAGMALVSLAAMKFVVDNGCMRRYGLSVWPKEPRRFWYFIPLFVLATGNLWGGIRPAYAGTAQLLAVLSMLLVGFLEELIFRGFLFKMMLKDGKAKTAVIVSSVTFGLGHLLNLLSGQPTLESGIQVCFAIAWGFMFTMVFWKSGSLWPGIIAHGLIDACSKFAVDDPTLGWVYAGATILGALIYCPVLAKLKTPEA